MEQKGLNLKKLKLFVSHGYRSAVDYAVMLCSVYTMYTGQSTPSSYWSSMECGKNSNMRKFLSECRGASRTQRHSSSIILH